MATETRAVLSWADRAILLSLAMMLLAILAVAVSSPRLDAAIVQRQNELEGQMIRLDARERTGRDQVMAMLVDVRDALNRIDARLSENQ